MYLKKKCFKKCGCSINGHCEYCDDDNFIGYDLFNGNRDPKYILISTSLSAPNTSQLACVSSNVEIQVRLF